MPQIDPHPNWEEGPGISIEPDVEREKYLSRRAAAERDTKEAKFHIVANVGVLVFLVEFFGNGGDVNVMEHDGARMTFWILVVGAAAASFVYAFSHARARSIDTIMAGDLATHTKAAHYFVRSRIVSQAMLLGFLISTLALAVGIFRTLTSG
ncbi:hypothetical protein G5B40_11105 [Pikeienuella piscinae]|uniref:Uncharacterized protein n=1 Tax=Pikeienuella piscinae TaxID=2748098 RepID=A0A7L5BWX0_9RHOB|nr:hypothetical protein [Pikeienuella piscinae]QIE55951.1 hypothetical protein G5B40_11105 [Pikeienuella piscinae]